MSGREMISTGFVIERPARDIAVLRLNRPPVNALDTATYLAAARAVQDLEVEGVRALVLAGAGERAFCAGTDRSALAGSEPELEAAFAASRAFFTALAQCSVPLVGAVNGPAVGGGAMIAAECDVLLAVPDASFALPELQLGFPGGGTHIRRLAGWFKGLQMMLLGERLSAAEAHAAGVVWQLVGRAELEAEACAAAVRLAALDPAVVRAAREIYRADERAAVTAGYRAEMGVMRQILAPGGPKH